MKHSIYSIFLAGAAAMALTGCQNESSFAFNPEEGQLKANALSVDYVNSGTRAAGVDTGDFTVNFVNAQSGDVVRSYRYAEMPEIISLPVGEYTAEAVYGEDLVAEWDNPFYEGESSFTIEAGKLTDDVEPIECTLKNMKVEVDLVDETGLDLLGDDVQVVVKAGKEGQLTYNSDHVGSAGFFRYDEGSNTIIAELSGTIDGYHTEGITRIYNDANAGKAYRIRFHINRPDNVNDGDITIGNGIKIDATIEIKDENHVVDPNEPEDGILKDDMRPVEDPGEDPGKDPGKDPVGPGDDTEKKGPEIVPVTEGLILDTPYEVAEDSTCVFKVTSESGITSFIIDIDSDTLTPEELENVSLASHLDLINPGELEEPLAGLGFPVKDQVLGQTECSFDITQFLGLLSILGEGDHKFIISVSDANGTTNGTIWLRTK